MTTNTKEMRDIQSSELGSVVGVERQVLYPHHYGSVHTPLPRPATIPEKEVDLGFVIGLHTAGGQKTGMRNEDEVALDAKVM